MKTISCNVAQKGFFAGPIHCILNDQACEMRATGSETDELERLHAAADSLKKSIERHPAEGENADIQQTALSILADKAFIEKAERGIKTAG